MSKRLRQREKLWLRRTFWRLHASSLPATALKSAFLQSLGSFHCPENIREQTALLLEEYQRQKKAAKEAGNVTAERVEDEANKDNSNEEESAVGVDESTEHEATLTTEQPQQEQSPVDSAESAETSSMDAE